MTTVATLGFKITATVDRFVRNIDKATRAVVFLSQQSEILAKALRTVSMNSLKAATSTGSLGSVLLALARRLVSAKFAALSLGLALFKLAKRDYGISTLNLELADTARLLGVSNRAVQQLRYAANRMGVEFSVIADATTTFAERWGEFEAGNAGELANVVKVLGMNLDKLKGLPVTEQMAQFNKMLEKYDKQQQIWARRSVFGDAGAEVMAKMDLVASNARLAALGVSKVDVSGFRNFTVAVKDFKTATGNILASVVVWQTLADAINGLTRLIGSIRAILNFVGRFKDIGVARGMEMMLGDSKATKNRTEILTRLGPLRQQLTGSELRSLITGTRPSQDSRAMDEVAGAIDRWMQRQERKYDLE